jgi:hypothetical protein
LEAFLSASEDPECRGITSGEVLRGLFSRKGIVFFRETPASWGKRVVEGVRNPSARDAGAGTGYPKKSSVAIRGAAEEGWARNDETQYNRETEGPGEAIRGRSDGFGDRDRRTGRTTLVGAHREGSRDRSLFGSRGRKFSLQINRGDRPIMSEKMGSKR